MGETGREVYIGCPNGIVLCADRCCEGRIEGRLYHSYRTGAEEFRELEQAFRIMEDLFDRLNFPMKGNRERKFLEKPGRGKNNEERMVKVVKDEELLKQHGDLGTFIIRVQQRQHNSWQGQVVWVEQNNKKYFRSVLELLKLIGDVVDAGSEDEEKWDLE